MNKTPFTHALLPAVVALALCLAAPVLANVMGTHNWETNSNPVAGSWTNSAPSYITVTDLYQPSAGGGGNTSGWLRIDYDATADPGPYDTDYIYVPASELFSGSWTNTMFITFDFWASNTVPGMLQVAWHSTNDNIWSYTLDDPTTNDWTSYVASLLDWEDWEGTEAFATEEMYLDDLAAIDWIGIGIRRFGTGPEFYGIDDFTLSIPEPAEMFMLAAALMTSAASLRRKKRKRKTAPEIPT